MHNHDNETSKIEALLFAAGEPVSVERLSKQLGISKKICQQSLEKLRKLYEEIGSGLQLAQKGPNVQLVSASRFGEIVAKFMKKNLNEPLSKAAVEVLSIVAYRGPLTRSHIEHIRGVNCSFTLRNLAIKGLIERKDNPMDSRAYLYEASMDFIKSMGISRIDQLPEYGQLHCAEIAVEKNLQDNEAMGKSRE